jgi:hypothetical protein
MSEWTIEHEINRDVYRPKYPLPEKPQWITCDFCDQKTEHATLRMSYTFCALVSHVLPYKYIQYDPGWASCVQCEALIKSRDVKTLVARSMSFHCYDPMIALLKRQLHELALLSFSDDEPIIWESGQMIPPIL